MSSRWLNSKIISAIKQLNVIYLLLRSQAGSTLFLRSVSKTSTALVLKFALSYKAKITFNFRWYKEDKNNVPAAYILQPISTHLPDFIKHEDREALSEAKAIWGQESEILQNSLETAANKVLSDVKEVEKYIISGTGIFYNILLHIIYI